MRPSEHLAMPEVWSRSYCSERHFKQSLCLARYKLGTQVEEMQPKYRCLHWRTVYTVSYLGLLAPVRVIWFLN